MWQPGGGIRGSASREVRGSERLCFPRFASAPPRRDAVDRALGLGHPVVQDLRGRLPFVDCADTLPARHVVLALGHSSRDTFAMLHRRAVFMEAKPFAVGFRIEHPQSLIDRARFGAQAGHPILGAADYKLVHHCENAALRQQSRSVYSFCMCPGGTVVAATSEVGRVVTNGMSQYSRNERNANAGLVVGITPKDFSMPPKSHSQPREHAVV